MGTLKLSKLRHLSNALKHHLKALFYVHDTTKSTRIRYAGKLDHPQIRPLTPKASTETHGLITLPIMRQTKLLSPTNTNVSKEICRIKPRIKPWDHSGSGVISLETGSYQVAQPPLPPQTKQVFGRAWWNSFKTPNRRSYRNPSYTLSCHAVPAKSLGKRQVSSCSIKVYINGLI